MARPSALHSRYFILDNVLTNSDWSTNSDIKQLMNIIDMLHCIIPGLTEFPYICIVSGLSRGADCSCSVFVIVIIITCALTPCSTTKIKRERSSALRTKNFLLRHCRSHTLSNICIPSFQLQLPIRRQYRRYYLVIV